MRLTTAQLELLEKLRPVDAARYNHSSGELRSTCLEDTRKDVLDQIYDWISDGTQPIFWLKGVAGIGKTTIAQTVAEHCARKLGNLGASFFFSRAQANCSDPTLVIRTIAYQLAQFHTCPGFKACIVRAVEMHPDFLTSNLRTQFWQLIVEPLQNAIQPPGTVVVVVMDALDECYQNEVFSKMLQTFVTLLAEVPFLKCSLLGGLSTIFMIGWMPKDVYFNMTWSNLWVLVMSENILALF